MFKQLTTNATLKLVSFFISVVLWFVVLGSRNVEVTKDMSLEVIVPPGLVVSNEIPEKISFRLSGPKAFLRNILNRKDLPIRVDLSSSKAGLITYRFFSDNIQVPIGVKVQAINPSAIGVKLESVKIKEVPLKLVTKGEALPGYHLAKLELTKNVVKIRGPEGKLDGIHFLNTKEIDLSQIHDSGQVSALVDLSNYTSVEVEGSAPDIRFQVSQEITQFRIRNASLRILTDRRYKVSAKEVSFYIRCQPEELRTLDRSKVYGVIDLRGKAPGIYEESVKAQLPDNVSLVKILPTKIKVTLY